jgi:hypothetical protein
MLYGLTIVAMAFVPSRQVLVTLNLLEVLAHVLGRPAFITSLVDDDIPIIIRGQGTNTSIVHGAPTQYGGTRVLDSQQLSTLGGV